MSGLVMTFSPRFSLSQCRNCCESAFSGEASKWIHMLHPSESNCLLKFVRWWSRQTDGMWFRVAIICVHPSPSPPFFFFFQFWSCCQTRTNISCFRIARVINFPATGLLKPSFTPSKVLSSQGGKKVSGNCLFKAVRSKAWVKGEGRGGETEKEWEREKQPQKEREKRGTRNRERKVETERLLMKRVVNLSRAECWGSLEVGWLGPDRGLRREGEKERERETREDWLPGWSRWEERDTNSYNLLQEACNYRARVSSSHPVPVGIKTPRCRG